MYLVDVESLCYQPTVLITIDDDHDMSVDALDLGGILHGALCED